MNLDENTCKLCLKRCKPETFACDSVDFHKGRQVRFVQGNRSLSGKLGTIVGAYRGAFYHGLYLVESDGQQHVTRFDHMMFENRITRDRHYRELYEHRLIADKYEYPEMRENVSRNSEVPLRQSSAAMPLSRT